LTGTLYSGSLSDYALAPTENKDGSTPGLDSNLYAYIGLENPINGTSIPLISNIGMATDAAGGIGGATPLAQTASFDQVDEVPEPSTWALLVGGLGTLMAFRRRR